MILSYKNMHKIRENHPNSKISIIKGSFDLFHYDHLQILKNIKKTTDILVVMVKSDDDIKMKGKNRPIIPEKERMEIVDSIKFVDYTILANKRYQTSLMKKIILENDFSEKEVDKFMRDGYIIEKIKPDEIFHIPGKKSLTATSILCGILNIKISPIPYKKYAHHTSDIINKCKLS